MKEYFKDIKKEKPKKKDDFTFKDAAYLAGAVIGTAIAIDILGDL